MNALEIQKNAKIINKFIGLWLILFVFGVLSHFFFQILPLREKKTIFLVRKIKYKQKLKSYAFCK